MARTYRLTLPRRVVNALVRALVRVGLGGRHTYLLRTTGRRTGRPYTTPVRLVENEHGRFLVGPYGERGWVKNARSAGWVELARAGRTERAELSELDPRDAAPVLREYIRAVPVTRPFFDVTPESSLEEFVAEAARHPVFRLGVPEAPPPSTR
jgi:deazaflavin-dependent oxidoreductase (nitroreductase family)